jgi:hypothetical protein
MSPGRVKLPSQTAALAGIPAGVQAVGPWSGRRQLFVRFANEAETATLYTADALKGELKRLVGRSHYHSIAVGGRDPLAESEFLATAFHGGTSIPVMLAHDGQRPDALGRLLPVVAFVQVEMDGTEAEPVVERACASLALAAGKQVRHALVIVPAADRSDAVLLRVVERAAAASARAEVIVHPSVESLADPDRRWVLWLERATQVHDDVRVIPRLPAPTGMR